MLETRKLRTDDNGIRVEHVEQNVSRHLTRIIQSELHEEEHDRERNRRQRQEGSPLLVCRIPPCESDAHGSVLPVRTVLSANPLGPFDLV